MQYGETLLERLERDGIAVLENFVAPEALNGMQAALRNRLAHGCWNSPFGYTNEDNYRLMVEDILTMDEGFQRTALDARLLPTLRDYLGPHYTLTEAKAWRSLPSDKDFHGWHNDAWYDHALPRVPRQLKIGIYLTDVQSGAFAYVKGTHGQTRHRHWTSEDLKDREDKIVTVLGKAGTIIIFDTSGIHRQTFPILETREAVFLCYNDPREPLQEMDARYYRYHPLHLNAAYLGGLSPEEQRVLGFGNTALLQPGYVRAPNHAGFEKFLTRGNRVFISVDRVARRVRGRLRRTFKGAAPVAVAKY